jgi:hypothetical protein
MIERLDREAMLLARKQQLEDLIEQLDGEIPTLQQVMGGGMGPGGGGNCRLYFVYICLFIIYFRVYLVVRPFTPLDVETDEELSEDVEIAEKKRLKALQNQRKLMRGGVSSSSSSR